MNTAPLRAFAPALRRQLMEAVTRKLDFVLTAQTPDLLSTFAAQVAALRKLADADRPGLVERAAYTWFNRFAALRYLDAKGWHPFRARVLMPPAPEDTQPELLKLTRNGSLPAELASFTDPTRFDQLLDGALPSADPQGEVYRLLVLAACRFYHDLLPHVFEAIDDETELLLPDDLLTPQSVVHGFRTEISDEDCASVEVLGWLYQFYISERKDQVMARKTTVPAEDIPAVTQLFTPHWIVRYLVENSLGRLWLLNRPASRLREHMPYYVEDAPAEPPPWQQTWWPRIDYRENDCRTWMWLRPNPALQGDYDATLWYAMTIDGYAYGRARWGIESLDGSGENKVEEIERAMESNQASFEDLRYSLFAIQRGIKGAESSKFTDGLEARFHAVHAALGRAWERDWTQHTAELPDLSMVGMEKKAETDFLRIDRPQEIRLIDPAVGSGHILTYAFDLLFRIYEEEGYAASEIPGLILRHNLHGLEISPRAAQLAELALVFKARERSRGFFRAENLVRPCIQALRNVRFAEGELKEYIGTLGLGDLFNQPLLKQMCQFEEAEIFGSLIQPCMDERQIAFARQIIEAKDMAGQLFLRETHLKVLRVLDQAAALARRYHAVITNPPYLNGSAMIPQLKQFSQSNYQDFKTDCFAMFVARSNELALQNGFCALITIQAWMYQGSFIGLRNYVISRVTLSSLVQIGFNSFPELNSKYAVAVMFCFKNAISSEVTICVDLNTAPRSADKENVFLEKLRSQQFYRASFHEFLAIPGHAIAYNISAKMRALFKTVPPFSILGEARSGLQTSDNDRFLRLWHEVDHNRISFNTSSRNDTIKNGCKWFPHKKGGPFRKWYGNYDYLVDWENDGKELFEFAKQLYGSPTRIIKNVQYYFRRGITWSHTGLSFGARELPVGFIFNVEAPTLFSDLDNDVLMAALNCKITVCLFERIYQSLHFLAGDVMTLPCLRVAVSQSTLVKSIVQKCMAISRTDWDNFETSWDFRDQPLLRPGLRGATLEASWRNWEAQSTDAIRRMQELETQNNRLFITAYGLEGELSPEVPENQITLARPDIREDTAAFLSYAVGCMMGRYSLDQPGLVLADTLPTLDDFFAKVRVIVPVDGDTALCEPENVVLCPHSRSACFSCGKVLTAQDGRFILADLYDRHPDQITGRPMVYCVDCAANKRDQIVLNLPLSDFSLAEGLRHRWTEPETFGMFVGMAGCFGRRVPATLETLSFAPDADGIIPVLDGEWFEDDIVAHTREFLRATFGEATLRENVRFLETSLGKDLRRYFLTDFYKDHLQIYKKRPIYWLVQSPDRGFAVLIYMHRYTRDTLNLVLNRYLREYQAKLRTRLAHLEQAQVNVTASARDKTAARKEGDKLARVLRECEEWERQTLLPLAQARIELDLDDGVKVNYLKLATVLAPIIGLAAKEEE